MKKSRFTDEQIIGFLKQAEAGMPVKELCRLGGFSDATFYKWRVKFGGMQASEATRLREVESENAKLKKLLAARYPGDEIPRGTWFYLFSRMLMARRWRSPRPTVKRGEYPK